MIYFHHDASGSIIGATGRDGELKGYVIYGVFGNIQRREIDWLPFSYCGKELDEESGLYYFGVRYYCVEIGRFTSEDPEEGKLDLPQSLNRYSYCLNNPVGYRDWLGLAVEEVEYLGDEGGGGVSGAAREEGMGAGGTPVPEEDIEGALEQVKEEEAEEVLGKRRKQLADLFIELGISEELAYQCVGELGERLVKEWSKTTWERFWEEIYANPPGVGLSFTWGGVLKSGLKTTVFFYQKRAN